MSSALQRDKNWSTVKCNPLQMIVEGVVSEDSSSSFKKCLEYSYNEAVSTQIDKISKSNEAKMKNYKTDKMLSFSQFIKLTYWRIFI